MTPKENKQTAVEWLVEQLRQLAFNPKTHLGMGDIRVTQGLLDELSEQAKQIEKEQIINAFGIGCQVESTRLIGYHEMAEQHYNETYNI